MAGNHLQIGQGIGEASTFDPNYAIQQFGNVLAQKKAQQQKQDQDLINAASQLSPDKIRKPDQADYLNKYNDWKQAQMSANALPQNSRDRLDALAAAQQKYADVHNFINSSREDAAHENSLTNMRLQNPHMFANEANDKIVKSLQAPMSSSDYISPQNYTSLERYVDPDKMDALYDTFKKKLVDNTQWDNGVQTPGMRGNKKGVFVTQTRGIPAEGEQGAMHQLLNWSSLHPDLTKYVQDRYPQIQGESPDETKALRLRQYMIDRGDKDGFYDQTQPKFESNYKPDDWQYKFLWKEAHKGDGGNVPSQPQSINIPFAGTGVVHAPNYVPLSLPNKNFAGATGVNLETGKPEKSLASSDSYSIVGAGDFPVSKVTGQIAQPNWAKQHPNDVEYKRMVHVQQKDPVTDQISSHLVPYENLPKNVANQKDVRTALGGLNKTPVYGQGQQAYKAVDGKQYNHADLLKLGYTEDQIKEAIKLGTLK